MNVQHDSKLTSHGNIKKEKKLKIHEKSIGRYKYVQFIFIVILHNI